MPEMQLMEYDFDNAEDVKPAVPDVQPARGSKKHKNKNKQSPPMTTQLPDASPALSEPIVAAPAVTNPGAEQSSPAAPSAPTVLEQVSAAFDVLPDFINDTNAITNMVASLLPVKKGTAAVVTGLAAAIVAYYCLSVKEE